MKNHLFPDESARCFVPEEDAPIEMEYSDILLKAHKMAEDIEQTRPVRMLTSTEAEIPASNKEP